MTTIRPGLYPLHDTTATNVTWPEDSAFLYTGYVAGVTPVPSADHNGKLNRAGSWHEYLDRNGVRSGDWLDTAVATKLTFTSLTYNAGGNVLTTGATVNARGAYLINATRVETDSAFLNPVGGSVMGDPLVYPGATVPGRIWVYADDAGQVRYSSVAAGTPDAPGGSEISLIGLDVNALGVVTNGAVVPVTLPLPSQYLPIAIDIVSSVSIDAVLVTADRMVVNGGIAGNPVLTVLPTAGESTVSITGDGGASPALLIPVTGSTAIATSTSGANAGVNIAHSGSGGALRVAPTGTGRGIIIQSTSTGVGLRSDTSGGTGVAIEAAPPSGVAGVTSTTDTSNAFYGVATSTGVGFSGLGGANSTSLAVRGEASHIDAYAIQGLTAAAATTSAAGVLGSGRGAGTGVYAFATGTGYGLIASADATTPTRAAMRLVPQDADPTTPLQGDLLFNSARTGTGKLRVRTTQWESLHSSLRGWVKNWGVTASGSTAGTTGNLSLAQITPEEVGDVLVTGTGTLAWTVDNGAAVVTLVDTTSALTIATSLELNFDVNNASIITADNSRTFVVRATRTLPSTATRSFAVVIAASTGTVTYSNVICSVEGVQ